jgi:diketogulonate reductase-like aldo/keto reductase
MDNSSKKLTHDPDAPSIKAALTAGFRHIDEAEMYENAPATGLAIRQWLGEDPERHRSHLFISTKFLDNVTDVETVCRGQLSVMGLDYFVSLLSLHTRGRRIATPPPPPSPPPHPTLCCRTRTCSTPPSLRPASPLPC